MVCRFLGSMPATSRGTWNSTPWRALAPMLSSIWRPCPASPLSVSPSSTSQRGGITKPAPRRTTGATPAKSRVMPASPNTKPDNSAWPLLTRPPAGSPNARPLLRACTMKCCPWVNAWFKIRLVFYIPVVKALEKMDAPCVFVPNGNDIHQHSFHCCSITSGSPKMEFKMNLFWFIDSRCHLVRRNLWIFISSIWPLLQAKFTASPSPLPLSHTHSFGLAPLCWLGHCSLWLNKPRTADWVSFSPSVKACILFSPSQTQAESGGLSFSANGKRTRFHFLPLGDTFDWTHN